MTLLKPVGRGASSQKYDLLTVLGARAMALGKAEQRLILRLITLITARYNWSRDMLVVGQREIARLWVVDERTVKREMALLRSKGWLVVRRQGARGRVTEYGLGIADILEDTRPYWAAVGPDFEARLSGRDADPVPIAPKGHVTAPDSAAEGVWDRARLTLYQDDPARYGAWLSVLEDAGQDGHAQVLKAPSRFHASYVTTHLEQPVLAACQGADTGIVEVRIIA